MLESLLLWLLGQRSRPPRDSMPMAQDAWNQAQVRERQHSVVDRLDALEYERQVVLLREERES